MAELVQYRGQVTSKSSASNLQPVASRTVLVTKRGASVDGAQTVAGGGNLTLHAGGNRFATDDIVQIAGDITLLDKVSSVTSDTVIVLTTGMTVTDGQRLVNLGADGSGGTGTPLYDGADSKVTIYTEPTTSGVAASDNKVTTDADGEYSFWVLGGTYDVHIMDGSTQLGSNSQTNPDVFVGSYPLGTQVIVVDGTKYPADDVGINAAIADVFALGGGKVVLPPGTYTLDAAIDLEQNIWLQGSGPETIIVPSATFPAPVTNATDGLIRSPNDNGDTGPPKYDLTTPGAFNKISDLMLDIKFSTLARSVNACIQLFGVTDVVVDSVWCRDGNLFGIIVEATKRVTVSNCNVKGFTHGSSSNGISIETDDTDGVQGNTVTIINNVVEDIGTIGINVRGLENVAVTGNAVRSCVNGIDIEGDSGTGSTKLTQVRNVTVSGNSVVGTTDTNVDATTQDKRGIVLWLRDSENSGDTDTIHYNINISNNVIKDYDTAFEALGGHWNFNDNNIYNYGNGGASSAAVLVGKVFGTTHKVNNFAIQGNYFQQTTRPESGTVGAILIDAGTTAAVDNVVIKNNMINGQDLTSFATRASVQHGIFIKTVGDNWEIAGNYFRGTTNQPIRVITENVGAPSNWSISNNYMVDCNNISSGSAAAYISIADTNNLTWSKIAITGNIAMDANSRMTYLAGNSGTGWTGALVIKDNYAKDATTGLVSATSGDVALRQGNIDNTGTLDVASDGFGGYWITGMNTELITLSTGGTTTDSSANLIPANSLIEGVTARVATTITTAVNYDLGDATDGTRFLTNNTDVTAGNTAVATEQHGEATTSGVRQGGTAAKLRITTNATPGAGAIRVAVYYRQFIPPTS